MKQFDLEATYREKLMPAVKAWASEDGGTFNTKEGIKFIWHHKSTQKPGVRAIISDFKYQLPTDYFDTSSFRYFKPVLRWLISNNSDEHQHPTWKDATQTTESLTWHFDASFSWSWKLKFKADTSFASASTEHEIESTVSGGSSETTTTSRSWSVEVPVEIGPQSTILCLHGALRCAEPIPFTCKVTPVYDQAGLCWSSARAAKHVPKSKHHSGENATQEMPIVSWLKPDDPSVELTGQIDANACGRNLITMYLQKTPGAEDINPDDPDLSVPMLLSKGWVLHSHKMA